MQISANGLKKLMMWEGMRLKIYKDSAGYPTIGVGHRIQPGEDFSKGLTTQQVMDLLDKDLDRFEANINNETQGHTLTQNQFDALVAFSFNIGESGFDHSTVLKEILKGDLADVPDAMRMWTRAGSDPNALAGRRENEIKLWLA